MELASNKIEYNHAIGSGGGIYVSATSSLSMPKDNYFTGNTPNDIHYE